MDYGPPVNHRGTEPTFFTEGAGEIIASENPNPEQSLNSKSYSKSYSERDLRGLAQTAMSSSSESTGGSNHEIKSEALDSNIPETTRGLGKIIPFEMPPKTAQQSSLQNPTTLNKKTAIITTNTLGESGIKEINQALSRFNQSGNAALFYREVSEVRNMTTENLENSYNRDLAA